jgi:hypothetical protein
LASRISANGLVFESLAAVEVLETASLNNICGVSKESSSFFGGNSATNNNANLSNFRQRIVDASVGKEEKTMQKKEKLAKKP